MEMKVKITAEMESGIQGKVPTYLFLLQQTPASPTDHFQLNFLQRFQVLFSLCPQPSFLGQVTYKVAYHE